MSGARPDLSGDRAAHRVVVVGGGLSGIAAALELAGAGCEVILLERRPFLGGRAFSFEDPETGAVIDNGQHVLAGACRRLRSFLTKIGSPARAFTRQRALSIPILDGAGRRATLAAGRLPAPLHLVPAFLRYRHLKPGERLEVARDARALARLGDPSLQEDVPLGQWLASRGASRAAVERFWEPLVTPALNIPVWEANVPLTSFFLRRALLGGAAEGALWLPRAGLSEAIGDPARSALEEAGVTLRLGERARAFAIDDGVAQGVLLATGETIGCDAIVSAIPPLELEAALPGGRTYDRLGAAAIVNAYLWYDRPVMDDAFAGTFGSPLQWLFDRERLLGSARSGGPCLGVSLSAAADWVALPKAEIAGRLDEAVERVLPRRRGARLMESAVVKEPRATFRASAGCGRLRPGPRGPAEGIWLAGDWTDTGWPATMEGAVRSGERAAAAALAARGRPGRAATRHPSR